MVAKGKIHPTLSKVYSLDETGQAAHDVHRNAHQGKVGVLCLAPTEGLGVRDHELRAAHLHRNQPFPGCVKRNHPRWAGRCRRTERVACRPWASPTTVTSSRWDPASTSSSAGTTAPRSRTTSNGWTPTCGCSPRTATRRCPRRNDLARQLEAARSEIAELRGQVERLSLPPTTLEGLSERLQRMLRLAQDEANEIKARAEAEGGHIRAKAEADAGVLRARYEKLIAELDERRTAMEAEHRGVLEKARAEADQIVGEAECRPPGSPRSRSSAGPRSRRTSRSRWRRAGSSR